MNARLLLLASSTLFVLTACSSSATPTNTLDSELQRPKRASDAGGPRDAAEPVAEAGARAQPSEPSNTSSDARATEPSNTSSDAMMAEPSNTGSSAVVAEPMDDAAGIFDPAVVHTFDVEIARADLERVDSDPKAEQYVPANLKFDGKSYAVGYRYKGSIGAFRPPCTAQFDGGPKAGKCSVKLSFNGSDPEGRFHGLKKLLFHAMNKDPSMLRERLGYALFREMGVPAPRATHAILRVNGQAGIYALVEEIDSRFTRSRFSEGGEGNLYKEIWPIHDDPQLYLSALETNEDDRPSVEKIVRFKDAVLQGADAMGAWMDRDVTTSYIAVDRVLMNDDGAFNFYCFPGGIGNNPAPPGNHNYYWYEAKDADRVWIIPWDLDNAMMETLMPPHISVDWRTKPSELDCSACSGGRGGFGGAFSAAPGCDRVIQNFQSWLPGYEARIDAFIAGPFSKPAVDAKLDQWKRQLQAAGYSVPDAAFQTLSETLDRARTNRGFAY